MKMSQKHKVAAGLLASGQNKSEVCRTVDIGRTTIHKWLRNKTFVALVDAKREKVMKPIHQAMADLHAGAPAAVAVLMDVVADTEAPHAARVKAAEAVLNRVGLAAGVKVDMEVSGADGEPLAVGLMRGLREWQEAQDDGE